ncbi:MAG: hypothetical protein ABI333_16765 [bacterium]
MQMRWMLLTLSLALPLALSHAAACSKKSPDRTTNETGPPPAPVRKVFECAVHADCVITHRQEGSCCQTCLGRAIHRDQLAALRAEDAERCKPGTFGCPKIDCARPKVKPVARCEKKRCVRRYEPAVRRTDIDTTGRYQVKDKLPPRDPCKTVADCAMTRMRPGHCCLTECPSSRVAGTKAWVAAVEALRKRRCSAWLVQSSMGCTYPKCDPKGRPELRCDNGRCTVHYKPLK